MKVYYVLGLYDGCYYVRCLLPMRKIGFSADKEGLSKEMVDRKTSAVRAIQSDIVVFQRPDEEKKYEAAVMLKKLGKKIVFENDDTFRSLDDEMKWGKLLSDRQKWIEKFLEISDLVITTTPTLKKEYEEFNDNVVICKNCVDPFDWGEPEKHNNKKFRIGLVGSVLLNNDFNSIRKALEVIKKDKEIQLVVFGMPPKVDATKLAQKVYKKEFDFWTSFNIEWQPFVPMDYYIQTLKNMRMDIMLIPRRDNYFNRCKSNLKYLEASMLEVPVIAQGFKAGDSPYQKDIKNWNNGVICVDDDEWLPAIYKLKNNPSLRHKLGSRARKYVLKHYDINNNYKCWLKEFKKLYAKS